MPAGIEIIGESGAWHALAEYCLAGTWQARFFFALLILELAKLSSMSASPNNASGRNVLLDIGNTNLKFDFEDFILVGK